PMMVTVIAVYCVLNLVIQSLIQPRFVGDSVGLSMTLTFTALIFWTWLLGPLGALLAIPMTLLFKALLVDVNPSGRWAIALAGSLERPKANKGDRADPDADDGEAPDAAAVINDEPAGVETLAPDDAAASSAAATTT